MFVKLSVAFLLIVSLMGACPAGKGGNPCRQCPNSPFLFRGVCLDQCPEGHIRVRTKGYFQCQLCDITKLLLPNKDKTQCVCAPQNFINRQNSQCTPCHYSCLTCSGPNQNNCLTCSSGQIKSFREKGPRNTCTCIAGFTDNVQNPALKCEKCHHECKTCSGPGDDQCIECSVRRIKNEEGLCDCSGNYITNKAGICECPSPFIMANGQCLAQNSQCGPNQIEVATLAPKNSGKSGNKNKNKSQFSGVSCSCLPGFSKIGGSCQKCGPNEELRKGRCRCVKEATKYKGECIICPKNQTFKRGECLCRKNEQKTESGDCIRCSKREVYKNGSCECVDNYFRNERGKCQKCESVKNSHPSCREVIKLIKQKKLSKENFFQE